MSQDILLPPGQATMANSEPVAIASDQSAIPVSGSLLEELLTDLRVLVANLGGSFPDTAGRTRVLLDAISASLTLATITTVGTVGTVTSVTNVTQDGGQPTNTNVGSFMNMVAYNGLRQQITVA